MPSQTADQKIRNGQGSSLNFVEKVAHRLSGIGQAMLAQDQGDPQSREILEALPVAIYATDAAGRLTFYNEAAAELWGRRPVLGEDPWCDPCKMCWPDGTPVPHDQYPMAVALETGRPVRGLELVLERLDGTRVPFAPYPTPFFGDAGEVVGGVNVLVDLTHRKLSEEHAQRLASIVQTCDDAIVGKDLSGIIRTWNQGAERLFGYTQEEVIGRSVTILIPPERVHEEQLILERLRRKERIEHYETVRRRKDGSLVEVSLSVSPIVSSDGRIIGASKVARDISQQKALLAEIMHRVKNTLATVQAIAAQTLRRAPAQEREALTARLHALSKAHDLLTSDRWDTARLPAIADAVLSPFERRRFAIEGPDLRLSANQSLQLTLALHELATNAVKYGALSNSSGHIRLAWKAEAGRVMFSWEEQRGPKVTEPAAKGFGSILIERTFEDVRCAYAPQGFACTFAMPV